MNASSSAARRDARDAIFHALAARLGGVARGVSVVRDGSAILALDDATRASEAPWIAGLAVRAHGCVGGWLRAALVVPRGSAGSIDALRDARAAVDDWGTVAHCTLARFLNRKPPWAFPFVATVRTRDPFAAFALATSGEVDVAAIDFATLASVDPSRVEVIGIGPTLPGPVWVGQRSLRPALVEVFRDPTLAAAREALRWSRLVEPSSDMRERARLEAQTVSPASTLVPTSSWRDQLASRSSASA